MHPGQPLALVLGWRADDTYDTVQLSERVEGALKKWCPKHHLRKDATDRPDINRSGISFTMKL
jgi:hypothetical protein